MGRAPCCDKENVKRGPWSHEEDAKLKDFINKYGTGGNWIALPQKAGLKRCGKSCRLRWLNYLRPNIKHGEFTDDEDKIIFSLYANIGSRWSTIAAHLPGRTDNDIKNYWNTKLKKKLLAMFPSFFPSLPLQSPTPNTSNLFLTNNSSPFYTHTTPNFMNLSNNIINTLLATTTLVQDQINFTHNLSSAQPLPNSLITNNNDSSFYLGFQEDHQSMYNHPMLMFGSGDHEGYHEVSTTGSSSEGGSCLSQMSYGNCSENHHHKQQQKYDQIKQDDQFSLKGFGDQSQSFMIYHMNYTDQKPKGYNLNNVYESSLHSELEEVKQLISNDDGYKTTHDHKEICYH